MIFDPIKTDTVQYDRQYVVVLPDWSFLSEHAMVGTPKGGRLLSFLAAHYAEVCFRRG
jgi:hypothetical protein